MGGTILLWGKTSIGKSPLTWEMASAIGRGTHFFGLPAREGRVLYVEVDTPEMLVAARLRSLVPAPGVWWEFMEPLSIPHVSPEQEAILRAAKEESQPDVVFVNTLRKVHDLDDKDSRAPKLVYAWFRHLFPTSALVFVHHMRKTNQDPKAIVVETEGFSGANNWLNDAQTGLHLEVFKGEAKANLRLYHAKSQVTEKIRPLPLFLDTGNGATLTSPLYEELLTTYEMLASGDLSGESPGNRDLLISQRLSLSPSTAKKRRLDVESGRFPGSRRFLLPWSGGE